jgi:hypothetical protein
MARTTSGSATESASAKLVVATHSATYSTAANRTCGGSPGYKLKENKGGEGEVNERDTCKESHDRRNAFFFFFHSFSFSFASHSTTVSALLDS